MDIFFNKDDRRSTDRFQTSTMVQYFIKRHSLRYMDCELVDVSRNGIAIRVPLSEDITTGMDVSLEITVPGSIAQMTLSGRVHRVLRGEKILAGIKFDSALDREVLERLIAR